jgi:MFS transporter, MHS family, proline/betaine transporter
MKGKKKIIASAVGGNIVEYYDFGLFATFTAKIGYLFFPTDDPFVQIIATFAVFALGFMMRPLGGLLFGYIGDTFGRRIALATSMLGMSIATLSIAVLPSYQKIGILAPILLTLIRLLQGLCLGGGGAGSAVFILEHTKGYRPGFIGSLVMASNVVGTLIAVLVGIIITYTFGDSDYGWRYGFVLGGIMGFTGIYLRKYTGETPAFQQVQRYTATKEFPMLNVFAKKWRKLGVVICLSGATASIAYTIRAYLNTFFLQYKGFSASNSLFFTALCLVLFVLSLPLFGLLSDKVGHDKALKGACLALLIFSLPAFHLLTSSNDILLFLGLLVLALLAAAMSAPAYTYAVYNFSPILRYSGISFSWNVGSALFSGTTPAIAAYLAKKVSLEAPAFYIMFTAALFLVACLIDQRWQPKKRPMLEK